jgi:phosphate transport system protein
MKLPRIKLDVNFLKITLGVVFSLIWGQVMYLLWPQPPYIIFVLFYLIAGSVLIKWVFFEIIDQIHLRVNLKAIGRSIDESDMRVREAIKNGYLENPVQIESDNLSNSLGFNQRLKVLEYRVFSFGNLVKTAMAEAVLSLEEKDASRAAKVIEQDSEIDHHRYALENDCLGLLRTGSLHVSNLRKIIAILAIISELERMADYAEGIAKITLMIGQDPNLTFPGEISQMAVKAMQMLEGGLISFRDSDATKAKFISGQDDQVDKLYDQVFRQLVMYMIEHPREVTQTTWLVWAAHNLERFADRVTNINERVTFSVSGNITEVKVSKY